MNAYSPVRDPGIKGYGNNERDRVVLQRFRFPLTGLGQVQTTAMIGLPQQPVRSGQEQAMRRECMSHLTRCSAGLISPTEIPDSVVTTASIPIRFRVRKSNEKTGPLHRMAKKVSAGDGPYTNPADDELVIERDLLMIFFQAGDVESIASFVFAIVSSTVSPWEKQPGKAGTSAQNPPSSAL